MKYIFAPDSFKGSLSAAQMTQILTRTAKAYDREAICCPVPVADGGEGTVEALIEALGGEYRETWVTGPKGEAVRARWGMLQDGTAVMEMAQASGLPLMGEEKDPMKATSYGTGELLAAILDAGCRDILIGIGGSATNDGGMGCLSALGVRFMDAQGTVLRGSGQELCEVVQVDASGLDPRVKEASLRVICDVTNPLLGETGATAVYGPQKGVTQEIYPVLEAGMARYAGMMERAGYPVEGRPGCGAAGGMGGALSGVLGAQLMRGIDAVLETVGFDTLLQDADFVFTGEGRLDSQSILHGKVVSGILERSAAADVPVIILCGSSLVTAKEAFGKAKGSIITTVDRLDSLENTMNRAFDAYEEAADRAFRLLFMGNMHE